MGGATLESSNSYTYSFDALISGVPVGMLS